MRLPLVIELQSMAVNQDTSVIQLVRTAKLVAVKLALADASSWIDAELSGYENLSLVPSYRVLAGECVGLDPYRGWMPVQFPDAELQSSCSEAKVGQPLGSMEPLLADGSDHSLLPYPFEMQRHLQNFFQRNIKFAIRLSKPQLIGIFDAVRNATLNWSLQLEQAGVLGENMSFTLTEKREAQSVTQQFFVQNAGVIGNVSDNATVTNHQQVTGELSINGVRDLVEQARTALSALPPETAGQVSPLLAEIDAEASKPQPNHGKLKAALASVRTICEGAGGSLVASAIVTGVQSLLS
ncbi:AbiTii domain-containing protein [Burkholderia contaminans]|uniref:AbiTii domain-containing protein n=1 Tax=Burkholderia contaminans TaxID=488447 RepID=UPI001CF4B5B1|nr:hypothetical protein [Burkholderia contaminans]MCA8098649.1 hypothetical protein [Burkholderia contaminans]